MNRTSNTSSQGWDEDDEKENMYQDSSPVFVKNTFNSIAGLHSELMPLDVAPKVTKSNANAWVVSKDTTTASSSAKDNSNSKDSSE